MRRSFVTTRRAAWLAVLAACVAACTLPPAVASAAPKTLECRILGQVGFVPAMKLISTSGIYDLTGYSWGPVPDTECRVDGGEFERTHLHTAGSAVGVACGGWLGSMLSTPDLTRIDIRDDGAAEVTDMTYHVENGTVWVSSVNDDPELPLPGTGPLDKLPDGYLAFSPSDEGTCVTASGREWDVVGYLSVTWDDRPEP